METVNVWVEVAKQVPSLGVLVWVVIHFLKHLEAVNASHDARMDRLTDEYRTMAEKNAALYDRVLEALGRAGGR